MNWRKRRQLLYIVSALIVLGIGVAYLGYLYFSTPGSCHDGVQNDGEHGADCGGPCARMCVSETRDPVVAWARALPNGQGQYTGVAYIENPQWSAGAAAYGVGYTMRLLDKDNHLIMEANGTVDLPAVETIPLVINNIPTGNIAADRAQLSFTTPPIVWTRIPADARPSLTVKGAAHADDWSRASATIVNGTNLPVDDLTVAAVLFDADGNAVAASQSLIQQIGPESSDDVVFTWPAPNPTAVRMEITPLPMLPPNPQP